MIKCYELKAFCSGEDGGNYLGAVLEKLEDSLKQKIAKKLGYSETVFIEKVEERRFKLEYFTPNSRIGLCGHATIGGFYLLKKLYNLKGMYSFFNDEIDLKIRVDEDKIIMEQKKARFVEKKIDQMEIIDSLNIDINEIGDTPMEIVSTGLEDIIIPIRSLEWIRKVSPNFKKIEEISRKYGVVGYHLFTVESRGGNIAFTRNFAPLYEIDEESATGTSNGALACYMKKHNLTNENNMIFEQGDYMDSPSRIYVEIIDDTPWVGGTANLIRVFDI